MLTFYCKLGLKISKKTHREKMDLRSSSINESRSDMLIFNSGNNATSIPWAVSAGNIGKQSNTSLTLLTDSSKSSGTDATASDSRPGKERNKVLT